MHVPWPLIRRSEEMRRVEAAIADPDVAGVAIRGPAGVGRTRLAREALEVMAARGRDPRWIVGTSGGRRIPLGAFTAWTPPDAVDTARLVRGTIESVTAAAPGAVPLVVVDDAHLLDDLSAFVIHQIAQRGLAKVVLTVVDDEPIPPAVQEIWKVGRFERLNLEPLSAEETLTLLTEISGTVVDPDSARRLWELTRGNALYLRSIVEQEIADRRLVQEDGYLRWTGDPAMPPDLAALIEARVGTLHCAVSDVVDILAIGEPVELATLGRMTDPAAVEEADIKGLILLDPGAGGVEVRLAHPLFGQMRRKYAAPTRLRRLRGLVAAELAASDASDDVGVLVRRATLSLDSDLPPDVDLLVRAAHGAIWLADLALADRLAAAAIRAGSGPEPNFLRAHALSWLGRGAEADAVLAEIPTSGLTADEKGRLVFLRASNLLWALADPVRAKEVVDEALVATPEKTRPILDAFLTVYWFATDRPDLALRAAEPLVVAELPPVVGAEIAWVLAAIAADAGRTGEAVAIAEAGYTAATRSFDAPHMRFNIADAHISALLLSGRVEDAHEVAERVQQEASDLPGAAQLLGAAVAGRAALGAGRLDRARPLLERAVRGLSAAGYSLGWGYRYRIPHAATLAVSGSTAAAADEMAALADTRRTFRSLDYERRLAQAWVSAGQGAVSEAVDIALSAAERCSAEGQLGAEVLCLQTVAQFGDHSVAPRLAELESLVAGPRAGLARRFACALRDGDTAELSTLSTEFERIGDLVAAVDAAAHAGAGYRTQQLRGSALTCSTRAKALAERGGGIDTPALRLASESLPLTDREREVVMLLGAGLSNREVAERLSLSVRTVESHVYRAMSKTGTGSRDELIALIPRRDQAQ